MQNNFPSSTLKRTFLVLSFCSLVSSAYAQYPVIPKPVQEKADALLADEEKRLHEIWVSNAAIIKEEAKQGKPYLPWASYPKDFVQAAIPAFPGAEGGGAFTQGGRGGKIFVVTSLE
ncbi:polysaccharide lyase, partial [Flavobacterium circumlabens]